MEIDPNGFIEKGVLYEFPSLITYSTYISRVDQLIKLGYSCIVAVEKATNEVAECYKGETRIRSDKLARGYSFQTSKLQPFFREAFK